MVVATPKTFDKLETRILFPATRLFSWVMVILLAITAIAGLVFFNSVSSGKQVGWDEVKRAMAAERSSEASSTTRPDIKVPSKFDKYFQGDNRETFIHWLADMDAAQRSEFLDGLWDVVQGAQSEDPTRITDAINQYHQMKIRAFAEQESNQTMYRIMRLLAGLGILLILGLAAVFALVIAILSIERANHNVRVAGSTGIA